MKKRKNSPHFKKTIIKEILKKKNWFCNSLYVSELKTLRQQIKEENKCTRRDSNPKPSDP